MQLKVIGQSADNNPSLKGVNFQKQPNLKQPPKTIMDKATLIRLTVNCLPNQTPPILLKNASDSLRQVKDNRFKVSDLLFHSAKMKKSSELNNPKSARALQSSYYQQQYQQQQSSQSLQKQSQGSFSLATSEDLETIKFNTCLNYPSTAIHQSQSSRGYLEELQSIKGSLNEYKDKEYLKVKKDKNNNNINTINNSKINKSNNKNNTKLQINIKTLNPNDKQAQQSSNYYSLGSCITNQSTDPDEITKQLIKQNLMIFSRRAVLVNNQTSRNVAQHMKSNSNGFGQADTQTSRMEQLQSARGSVRDENSIITNSESNLGQYQIETSKSLQQSLRNIPVIRTQTQLTACGTLDKMETSQKDNLSEKSSEQVTQLSTMSSAVFAGNEEEKNSIILQQDIHSKHMKIKGELKIQKIKLQFQENKRQFIKSSQETKRKFKREEEQIISKYEYPIISQEIQQKDHEQQIKSQVLDIKRKQPKIVLRPQLLSGCSPIRDLSKKRPQTARIAYKKLSTVPDKYQDNGGEQNFKTVNQIDKDNNIDQDIFQNVKAHTHRHVRSQSPKEELNMYEQFLCRVLRNERTAVFERIKQNASVMGKQSQGNSQKLLTNVETQKLISLNIEKVEKKETRGSLLSNNADQLQQYLQELKNPQETNKQEQEQENHGKVCPWQEWNEEIGYDEASLDFIRYANSP